MQIATVGLEYLIRMAFIPLLCIISKNQIAILLFCHFVSNYFSFHQSIVSSSPSTMYVCQKFLFSLINSFISASCAVFSWQDKDNVLCRQADKIVTFATMIHKYLEAGGTNNILTWTWTWNGWGQHFFYF